MIVRIGLPTPTGAMPVEVERLESPALVSAGALWDSKRRRFRRVPFNLADLDCALDSAGFVAHRLHGGYLWSVDEYVTLAGSWSFAWWSAMDYACEPEIAGDPQEVYWRVLQTSVLLAECRAVARGYREAGAFWLQNPMPILQGQEVDAYLLSAELTHDVLRGQWPALVGVGSMCRRLVKGPAGIWAVLRALDAVLPRHVRLHLFGVKGQALDGLRGHPRIASVDSQAWDRAARQARAKAAQPAAPDKHAQALALFAEGKTKPEVHRALGVPLGTLTHWCRRAGVIPAQRSATIDLTGQTFGKLTVLRPAEGDARIGARWLCRCACGGETVAYGKYLRAGDVTSCGCKKVGHRNHPYYEAWHKMAQSGSMAERWRRDFAAFVADVGERPSPAHVITRLDKSKPYEPGNLRWATRKEVARSRRSARIIEHAGQARSLAEWAETAGLPYHVLSRRLEEGWSFARAIETPRGVRAAQKSAHRQVEEFLGAADGEAFTVEEIVTEIRAVGEPTSDAQVRAALLKLEHEGVAVRAGYRWSIPRPAAPAPYRVRPDGTIECATAEAALALAELMQRKRGS